MGSRDEMTHGFNEWMLAVNDAINGTVNRIVNILEWNSPIWIVPRFFRSRDPFDYGWDKIRVELFLVWRWDIPNFSCVNYLPFRRLSIVSDRNCGLERVCMSGGTAMQSQWCIPLHFFDLILLG